LNLFIYLHRSVFDRSFYKEVEAFSGRKAFKYLATLILITTFISALSHTYYLFDSEKGVVTVLSKLFGNMEIVNGRLDPKMSTPYVPPSFLVARFYEKAFGIPDAIEYQIDSSFIIDTSNQEWSHRFYPVFLFQLQQITMKANEDMTFQVPYNQFVGDSSRVSLSVSGIRRAMKSNLGVLFFYALFWSGIRTLVRIVFSVFFLAFAAYIFRVNRNQRLSHHLKVASFAVTPIAFGMIMVSISGVRLPWAWYLFIFIATILMFRAGAMPKESDIR